MPLSGPDRAALEAVAEHDGLGPSEGEVYGLLAADDEALTNVDVLVLPTLPMRATVRPPKNARPSGVLARTLEMLANTAPLDVPA